jgi:DNA (cytosine-5)-methyltransferase 1
MTLLTSRTKRHSTVARRHRSVPRDQLMLELQLPATELADAPSRNGRGRAAKRNTVPPTERFEVDQWGRVHRVVLRRSGGVSRMLVARVKRAAGDTPPSQSELAMLADEQFLRARVDASVNDADSPLADHAEEVRVVDMFGGCGAMSLGIAEACRALGMRFRAVGAFEIEDFALSVYCRNFGGPEPKRDVERLLSKRLTAPTTKREKALVAEIGRVDCLVAGPPCVGHSNLNNATRRQDPKNELYYRIARFVRLFEPKWVIIENVQAVLHDDRKVVDRTRRALRTMGYTVDDGVVRLADLGVPQTRRRHILVAVKTRGRGRVALSETEVPTLSNMVARFRVPHRSLRWAIQDLEDVQTADVFDSSAVPSEETKRRIKWLFENHAYELDDAERPECHRDGSRHEDGKHRYIGVYGRMRWDEPGPTITGGYDTMGRGRFVHPSRRRTITPHEAARIQFFPDWFDFAPATRARTRLARVIGNAVPPKLTYAIALELLR